MTDHGDQRKGAVAQLVIDWGRAPLLAAGALESEGGRTEQLPALDDWRKQYAVARAHADRVYLQVGGGVYVLFDQSGTPDGYAPRERLPTGLIDEVCWELRFGRLGSLLETAPPPNEGWIRGIAPTSLRVLERAASGDVTVRSGRGGGPRLEGLSVRAADPDREAGWWAHALRGATIATRGGTVTVFVAQLGPHGHFEFTSAPDAPLLTLEVMVGDPTAYVREMELLGGRLVAPSPPTIIADQSGNRLVVVPAGGSPA